MRKAELSQKQFVIVGLGNPGKKYSMTRHNLGFLVVEAFAATQGWSFKDEAKHLAMIAKGKVGNHVVHLVLPQTYMNLSGQAVRRYLDYYQLTPSSVRVVTDDIDLNFGELRVRNVGSAGGHNGLKSIQAYLNTQHYVRLRMGIGKQSEQEQSRELADYVLDTFTGEENKQLPSFVERGVAVLNRLITEDVSVVMNAVNKKSVKLKDDLPS